MSSTMGPGVKIDPNRLRPEVDDGLTRPTGPAPGRPAPVRVRPAVAASVVARYN